MREDKLLWLGALAFHWSLLVILLRHLRFFVEPVPRLAVLAGQPRWLLPDRRAGASTSPISPSLAALVYLLQRRLRDPQVRYISLFTDYFALFLLLGIAISGVWMRYFARVGRGGRQATRPRAHGLRAGGAREPERRCSSIAPGAGRARWPPIFPFSKLMHMGGVFLSPTRNLANNNRMKRHVNPWNYPVKVHTYEEWEDEFRDKIEAAGLPVERH